jgi:DNA polymerase elongation subunit (family B)
MEEIPLKTLLDKIEKDEIQYNQVYGSEIEANQYFSITHYLNNPNDTIEVEQKLNIVFFDIEVYNHNREEFNTDEAIGTINAITLFDTKSKNYYSYILLLNNNKDKFNYNFDYKTELLNYKYINNDENIIIYTFNDELSLLEATWNKVKEIDPATIAGFNSNDFDLPYIYNRLLHLYNNNTEKVNNLLSRFGIVKVRKFNNTTYQIPELPMSDIMKLYKPRDEGGNNYGRKLYSYSLDVISNHELKLKKLDYKDTGLSLDKFYEIDPNNFLKYNIIDVALTVRLNEKLKHIELHNLLRRDTKSPFTGSMIGVSIMYNALLNYELLKRNLKMRYAVINENSHNLSKYDIARIDMPKEKKTKWNIKEINEKTFKKLLSRYPGAYVKEGQGKLYTLNDGIIVDQDATALYPSMILENNIGTETYYGRVLDPSVYQFIQLCKDNFGTDKNMPPSVKTVIFDKITKAVTDKIKPQNKNDYKQYMYLIFMHLLNKLKDSNVPLSNILKPTSFKDSNLLKMYFIPLIDILNEVNSEGEYNLFAYQYIINNEDPDGTVYILQDEFNNPNIINIPSKAFKDYIVKNNLTINISGALIYKHEFKRSMIAEFVDSKLKLRKQYKDTRDEYKKGEPLYTFYDRLQHSQKINVNSLYGSLGLNTFAFSNKHLAASITLSGRVRLKIAQIYADMYLENSKEN